MGVSPIQHIGVRAHPDEWNPFSDWPHEQLEVNAEREEEVRASSIAAGQRIGLVVDDEANVVPQFAGRQFGGFEPELYNAPSVSSSRNASFEDDVPLAQSDRPEEWEVPTTWLLGRGTGSRSENFMEQVIAAAGPSPSAEVISTAEFYSFY